MDTNENNRTSTPEDVILLGVASTETMGGQLAGEDIGGAVVPGISEE